MLGISQDRRSALQKQQISQYHLNTARIIEDTARYTRLIQPLMPHLKNVPTFDIIKK